MKKLGLSLFLALVMALPLTADASENPYKKPVKVISGMAPGSGPGINDAFYADLLAEELGVPVKVVYSPGAGTIVSHNELLSNRADGQTILMSYIAGSLLSPAINKTPYKEEEFEIIGNYVGNVITAVVREDSPYKTLQDAFDHAKKTGEPLRMNVTSFYGIPFVSMIAATNHFDIPAKYTEIRGACPLYLERGDLDILLASPLGWLSYAEKGSVRALATMTAGPSLPGVPTLKEAVGFDAYGGFQTVIVKKGIPRNKYNALVAAHERVMKSEKMKEYSGRTHYMNYWATPEDSNKLRQEVKSYFIYNFKDPQ